ncbi:MAG TPA: restriction endonuclease subunit R [Flavobacteriales bacterium]|jgi:hypothetical protein|nr:restriction endonuclease subunit R [Flavobacteriales bacterium]
MPKNQNIAATTIFDPIRKKYVLRTPEEEVRQRILRYLIDVKGYPVSRIAVEKELTVKGLKKRTDILYYDKLAQPALLVECKAPRVKISQRTFDQAFRYNLNLGVRFVVITNGEETYCCQLENDSYTFLHDIPDHSEIE